MLSILSGFSCTQFSLKPSKARYYFHRVGSVLYREFAARNINCSMDDDKLLFVNKKQACERICLVSSFTTELLEMQSEDPLLHVLVIPGNPGVVSFYKEFIEAMYELLDGKASLTVIGHIAHTRKVDFIKQELQDNRPPLILVGHSIGSYICLEVLKKFPQQVKFAIGLYPFLAVNKSSSKQLMIEKISRSALISASISSFVSLLGFFPDWLLQYLVKRILGQSWSSAAIDATCSSLIQETSMKHRACKHFSKEAKQNISII